MLIFLGLFITLNNTLAIHYFDSKSFTSFLATFEKHYGAEDA